MNFSLAIFYGIDYWAHVELARKSSPNMEIEAELSDVVDLTTVTVHEAELPLPKQRGGASHMGRIDKAFDNLKRIRVR